MPTKIEKDSVTGTDTTGHEWDGVKELNTPLPKWWLYVLYATIAWAVGYMALYPSWPSLSRHYDGLLGYSTRVESAQRVATQSEQRSPFMRRIAAASLAEIQASSDLFNFSQAAGRAAFADNCAPCHGAGGGGTKGFPNLADDDWLWGGDVAAIHRTVSSGVRNTNGESRVGPMPRFGADGILTQTQIGDVAEFVLSLSQRDAPHDAAAAGRGARLFAENCAACHGDRGAGNQEFGAPNLSDGIWLYGGDRATVVQSISNGRNGSMPAWSERLSPETVKMLAIYVHSLGGGK